jgi:hypothetical protein
MTNFLTGNGPIKYDIDCCWNRADGPKARRLKERRQHYMRSPYGGATLTLQRVQAGATRAQWWLSDGMQGLERWPTLRRALWTMRAAGFEVVERRKRGRTTSISFRVNRNAET